MRREEVEAAFERYGRSVLRRARAILGDPGEAEDVMQEVFVQLLRGRMADEGPVSGWLARVTSNLCLNRLRDRARQAGLRDRHLRPPKPETPSTLDQVALRAVLAQVDEDLGAAAVAVYVDGMTHDEAAALLGVSKRTIANRLDRFRAQAGPLLEEA